MMNHRPFNIMCKPVSGQCNLACEYCYYLDKPRNLYPDQQPKMSLETLEKYTREYIDAMPTECVFGWQGGEPTLAGLDFYEKAVEFQKKYKKPGQRISNSYQTNGTLLTEDFCEFLAKENFLIGLSIDGPEQIHDYYRKDKLGKATFAKVMNGLELLKKHKVEYNILVTLNARNVKAAADIYRFFTNMGEHYLQFIPILERDNQGQPLSFSATPKEYGKFMLDVFNLWKARDIARVSVRFIDSFLHALIFGRASTCMFSPQCANAHILEFNGDVYACDHFVFPQWLLGNINETPLLEILKNPRLKEFEKLKTDLPEACKECCYLELCYGGCPKHHVPLYGDAARTNYFCEAYKYFFENAGEELKRMADEYKRSGQLLPPKPTRPAGPANANVGRNDPCPCGSGRKFKHCCGKK